MARYLRREGVDQLSDKLTFATFDAAVAPLSLHLFSLHHLHSCSHC